MEPIPKKVVWRQLLAVRMCPDLLPALTFGLDHCAKRVEPAFEHFLPGVGQMNDDEFQQVEAAIVRSDQGEREKERFTLRAGFDERVNRLSRKPPANCWRLFLCNFL